MTLMKHRRVGYKPWKFGNLWANMFIQENAKFKLVNILYLRMKQNIVLVKTDHWFEELKEHEMF
jgi:hypothetical protein